MLRDGKVSLALSQGMPRLPPIRARAVSPRTGHTQRCAPSVACIRSRCTSSSEATVPLLPYRSLPDAVSRSGRSDRLHARQRCAY